MKWDVQWGNVAFLSFRLRPSTWNHLPHPHYQKPASGLLSTSGAPFLHQPVEVFCNRNILLWVSLFLVIGWPLECTWGDTSTLRCIHCFDCGKSLWHDLSTDHGQTLDLIPSGIWLQFCHLEGVSSVCNPIVKSFRDSSPVLPFYVCIYQLSLLSS